MRELKFRARFRKITTGQEIWQFAALGRNNILDPIKYMPGGYLQVTDWEQFTGFKDKNDNEIYEEDIIKGTAFTKGETAIQKAIYGKQEFQFIAVVKWDLPDAGFYFDSNLDYWPHIKPWFAEQIEIIGNIYENPELLNEK